MGRRARAGAGRKKSKTSHDSPHRSRAKHIARHPLHVVLRALPDVGRLRRPAVHEALAGTLAKLAARTDFRIVHMSLQHDHVHAIVEADDNAALESGMRGFAISFARRINRALARRGRGFAYRYHTTPLTTPTQTRNAICYVLANWRRHNTGRARAPRAHRDPRSLLERDLVRRLARLEADDVAAGLRALAHRAAANVAAR